MDDARFDSLARTLAGVASRRTTLAGVLGGFVVPLLAGDETSARKRAHRKRAHERGRDHDGHGAGVGAEKKKKKKKCKPPTTKCGKKCFNLQTDPANCGGCGVACAASQACQGGVCTCNGGTCSGCCTGKTCAPGASDQACGKNGAACQVCSGGRTCQGGACTCPAGQAFCNGACIDVKNDPDNCGSCGHECQITASFCNNGSCGSCGLSQQCLDTGQGDICCNGACLDGECCSDGQCTDPAKPFCTDNICSATCTTSSQCDSGNICVSGTCTPCDVCASGCDFDSVQDAVSAASSGDTIYICPGEYQNAKGRVTVDDQHDGLTLTLIGAGDGVDTASDTILKNTEDGQYVMLLWGTITLKQLRITGGRYGGVGGGISSWNSLTMANCTVNDNRSSQSGGGLYSAGSLLMKNCTIQENQGVGGGGFALYRTIMGQSSTATVTDCLFDSNKANGGVGGGIFVDSFTTLTFQGANTVSFNTTDQSIGGGIFLENETTLNGFTTVTFNGNQPDQCFSSQQGGACS